MGSKRNWQSPTIPHWKRGPVAQDRALSTISNLLDQQLLCRCSRSLHVTIRITSGHSIAKCVGIPVSGCDFNNFSISAPPPRKSSGAATMSLSEGIPCHKDPCIKYPCNLRFRSNGMKGLTIPSSLSLSVGPGNRCTTNFFNTVATVSIIGQWKDKMCKPSVVALSE